MKEMLEKLRAESAAAIAGAADAEALEALRVKYLGKKGELTAILKQMGKLSAEERPVIGQLANSVRAELESELESRKAALAEAALEAQRAVSEMTNELLRKNAEKLKTATTGVAREAERGILDLNTLVETNQSLIDTISEVMKIQDEGRAQRVEAEKQLLTMENELKQKLLELKH